MKRNNSIDYNLLKSLRSLTPASLAAHLAAYDHSDIAHGETAYTWGNHASAGYLTSQISHADVLVDGDFTSQGIMLRGASAGTYSILTNASTNWNTAYGWGNHAGLYLGVALKGAANGVAELDESGWVKNTQLPSYVDDVLEYANFAALPVTGETGKIYITQDTNKTYRWSGSAYAEISASLALGETSSTAYRGDRGKTAYDHSQIVGGDSVHVSVTENSNWDAAYGWGNHASAGYAAIASPTFTGIVTTPALKVTTGAALGNILISDADGDLSYLAAGATTTILVGGGAANPVWTTATGTGAPVRAGSPTFTGTVTTPSLIVEDLTDGYIPYQKAIDDKLSDSPIYTDGTAVNLYHSTNLKLATTAAGLSVTGNISFVSADRVVFVDNSLTDITGKYLNISAGSTIAGTSTDNVNGGSLYLDAGKGTGTGTSNIYLRTSTTLASGKTLQTLSTKVTILGNGYVGIGLAPSTHWLEVGNTTIGGNFKLSGKSGVSYGLVFDNTLANFTISQANPDARYVEIKSTSTGTLGLLVQGNVGIGGSTIPPIALSVYGSSGNVDINIGSRSGVSVGKVLILRYNLTGDYAQIASYDYAVGAKNLVINPLGGTVGIGTTAGLSKLSINGGLHVGGDSDAGDNNLLVDGTIKGESLESVTAFSTGFAGNGYKIIETGGVSSLEVDSLTVRGLLKAYELQINKIHSINGGLVISVANAKATTVSGTTIYFDEGIGLTIPFVVNDYIRAQQFNGTGVAAYTGKVTAVNAGNIVATTISGTPYNGMELVQFGNSATAARQNMIYMTAADTNNPYIAGYSGVTDGVFTGHEKFRLGNLVGVTDADFGGALSGYGLYAANVYLTGSIKATAGLIGGFTIDATAGLYSGTGATRVQMKAGAGIWTGATAIGDAPFSVTNAGVLKSTSGTIGGFTISATDLYAGTGATRVEMQAAGGFWAGATAIADAPFSVTPAGLIKATSGTIGGWTLGTDAIYTGTKKTTAGYTADGITIASNGSLRAEHFEITEAGYATFESVDSIFNSTVAGVGNLAGSVAATQANIDKVARQDRVELTGTSGSCMIYCNNLGQLATFNSTLTQSAADFASTWGSYYYSNGISVTYSGAYIFFTANTAGVDFTYDTSVSMYDEDLDGVVTTTANNNPGQARIDTITLTGDSGTANILCDGVTKQAVWSGTNLTDTAADFARIYGSYYTTGGVTVTSSSNTIIFTSSVVGQNFTGSTTITNVANPYQGSITIQGNHIYEDNTNNDTVGTVLINRIGYNGGTSKYRHLVIGNGRGEDIVKFIGQAGFGQINLYADTIYLPNIPVSATGAGLGTGQLYRTTAGALMVKV